MKRKEFYDALYLAHHGIKGQQCGKRNGPPYPLDEEDHSPREQNQKKGLTDGQKRAIKIGAGLAVAAIATYGAYKLHQSGALSDLGIKKASSVVDISKAREKREQKYWDAAWNETNHKHTDYAGLENPSGRKDNCKDVSEATLKRWLGVDPGAVAGEKSVNGSLYDFVEQRGYNPKGVTWINDIGGINPDKSGDSVKAVSDAILKKFKDGDCGMIGIDYNKERVRTKYEGHAFNWMISGGKVRFVDNQPDPPLTDASDHLRYGIVNPNKYIEIVKLTKDAFSK